MSLKKLEIVSFLKNHVMKSMYIWNNFRKFFTSEAESFMFRLAEPV